MRCKSCHYSLESLTGPPHRCPECGREFDPTDPGTFASAIRTGPQLRTLLMLWISFFAVGLVLAWWWFAPSAAMSPEMLVVIIAGFILASLLTGILWPLYAFAAAWWESR